MSVRCLCWNCGREITVDEEIVEANEELWCEDCAAPSMKNNDLGVDENE